MFLQNTILGANTPLYVNHSENGGVLPSASTVTLFRYLGGSPYWQKVADYDVLAVGAIVDGKTGEYGILLATSTESAGTFEVRHEWTSSMTGYTYINTYQFNIVADTTAILARLDSLMTEFKKRAIPDNARIVKIARALGVDNDGNNPLTIDYVSETQKTTGEIHKMVQQINRQTNMTREHTQRMRETTRESLSEYNKTEMMANINKVIESVQGNVAAVISQLQSSIADANFDGKLNTVRAFDLWSRQIATLFTKVDYLNDQIKEIKDAQVDFAQALPQMVVEEQRQMIGMAAQNMVQQGMGMNRPQQGM